MATKSTRERYGVVAVALHWSIAVLIVLQLLGGWAAVRADGAAKIGLLKFHAPIGVAIGLLAALRILWWLAFDRKPDDVAGMSRAQAIAARAVHGLLYLAPLALAASGFALLVMSGANRIVFGGGQAPLPDLTRFALFRGHVAMAIALLALVAAHVGAALYHQFVARDNLLARMR
jgi:cytochrome b561